MSHPADAEISRKPLRILIPPNAPIEVVKLFAGKISESFHRQTTSARQKYRQTFRQLEAKFLNSSQGEAGLIFAVPNIPANITPAELASAFNETFTRLCNESQEIQFSNTSLPPDSSFGKDLLDLEYEQLPPTSNSLPTTASPESLLEYSDSSTAVESHSTSQRSLDELLYRHSLDGFLKYPLFPTTRQAPEVKTSEEPIRREQAPTDPVDFLRTLVFRDLSPYPLVTKASAVLKRTLTRTRARVSDIGSKKTLVRKPADNNLRQASMENFAKDGLVVQPTSHPQCLRPGPLHMHRAKLSRSVPRLTPTKTYTPSNEVFSPYTAYEPGRAPLLPVAYTTADTLMDEMTNELDKVLAAFDDTTNGQGMPDKTTSEAHKLDPLLLTFQPIVPLRVSSRDADATSKTAARRSLPFKDRLLEASRSAILAAAKEAETSEMRWFHCGR